MYGKHLYLLSHPVGLQLSYTAPSVLSSCPCQLTEHENQLAWAFPETDSHVIERWTLTALPCRIFSYTVNKKEGDLGFGSSLSETSLLLCIFCCPLPCLDCRKSVSVKSK